MTCAHCGKPLTGGVGNNGKGKKNKRDYGNYWCYNAECREVFLRKEKLEAEFVSLLACLSPTEESVRDFRADLANVWKERQANATNVRGKLRAKLEEMKRGKASLIREKAMGNIEQPEYEEGIAMFKSEIAAAEKRLFEAEAENSTFERLARFGDAVLKDFAGTWQRADVEHRARVQNVLFPDGLEYHQEKGFLNPEKSSLLNYMHDFVADRKGLASPAGFEPALPP